jgi:hypothetical protein
MSAAYGNFIDQSVSNKSLSDQLLNLETSSVPVFRNGFMVPVSKSEIINGHKVEAKSKLTTGRAGKGFTTLWFVDGERVTKANLESVIAA